MNPWRLRRDREASGVILERRTEFPLGGRSVGGDADDITSNPSLSSAQTYYTILLWGMRLVHHRHLSLIPASESKALEKRTTEPYKLLKKHCTLESECLKLWTLSSEVVAVEVLQHAAARAPVNDERPS